MKKLFAGIAAAALSLAYSGTAFAATNVFDHSGITTAQFASINLNISNSNTANLKNNVSSNSNTGNNTVFGHDIGSMDITTGNANSKSLVHNEANNTETNVEANIDITPLPLPTVSGSVYDNSGITANDNQAIDYNIGSSSDVSAENNVTSNGDTGGNLVGASNDLNNGKIHTGVATSGTMVQNSFNNIEMDITKLKIIFRAAH